MTHPVDNSPPDVGRQRLRRPERPDDDRRSRSYSPRERHARGRVDVSSSKPRRRRRDSNHSEDTQGYELHRNRSPRHRRERREQMSSDESGDEDADTLDTPPLRHRRPSGRSENLPGIEEGDVSIQRHSSQRPELVGRNTGGTLPQPSEVLPPVIITRPGTEGFSTQSSDSESEIESRMSRWEDLVQRGISAPIPIPIPIGPLPMAADLRPRQRRRSSRTQGSSWHSSGGSENPGSLGEAPRLYQAPHEVELLAIGTCGRALT
jgi:hypothetical protein